MIGVRADGTKELTALDDGHHESTESWLDLLRGRRGLALSWPGLIEWQAACQRSAIPVGLVALPGVVLSLIPASRMIVACAAMGVFLSCQPGYSPVAPSIRSRSRSA
jgi:hypothetical protein